MVAPRDSTSGRPVLGYVEPTSTQVTSATTLTGFVALAVLVCVGAGLIVIALEAIGAYRAARWSNQQSLDRALVILARPRTFQRPEFAGRWWLAFALTACAAWAVAVTWTAVAAQRVVRFGSYALPSLQRRAWTVAGVAVISAATLLAFGAHIRRVFRDWEVLGDFLYRSTGLLTVMTVVAAVACCALALWTSHRSRRLRERMPHSPP